MGAGNDGGHRAVFLDRDGVINRNALNPATGEYESPLTEADFEFAPGVFEAMQVLRAAGFLLFLVSNQPNYAKGKSSLRTLNSIHEKLLSGLKLAGIEFADFYYCFHHPQGSVVGYSRRCECRKPSPYFLLKAQAEFDVDLRRSWMVGDRQTDVECGIAAGTKAILIHAGVLAPEAEMQPDGIAPDLFSAARLILVAE
ncbi:MAG TPA: HAD family hydrolase [Silvibacterium sp.]|jgi:D-glycero-D-manno-heptose 1,7-bisphosphate phosphatase|nr:HAD family hydrolase [Silvibacterium sp.]